jgi:hypothetical protein
VIKRVLYSMMKHLCNRRSEKEGYQKRSTVGVVRDWKGRCRRWTESKARVAFSRTRDALASLIDSNCGLSVAHRHRPPDWPKKIHDANLPASDRDSHSITTALGPFTTESIHPIAYKRATTNTIPEKSKLRSGTPRPLVHRRHSPSHHIHNGRRHKTIRCANHHACPAQRPREYHARRHRTHGRRHTSRRLAILLGRGADARQELLPDLSPAAMCQR